VTYFFYEDGYEFDEWLRAGIRTLLFGAFNLERQLISCVVASKLWVYLCGKVVNS